MDEFAGKYVVFMKYIVGFRWSYEMFETISYSELIRKYLREPLVQNERIQWRL